MAITFIGAVLEFFPELHWITIPFQSCVGSYIDLMPYVERHICGDWQHLEPYDRQQNKRALKEGARIFTSFEIPFSNEDNDWTETIFIITESDRAQTTIMCAHEY